MGESRAYRLESGEPLPEGIARIARGRIDHAMDELRGKAGSTPEQAVHEARKDMKKLRALLRLARGELGERTYARENACFRDAARELAGARDADVMVATLKALQLPDGLGWELRKRIQDGHSEQRSEGREAAARGAVAILEEARGRIDDWPLERDSFAALAEGLERTYRRGRREFKEARAETGTESLHEWRKRVKELWYHASLLRCAWPPVMTAFAGEAHELSDRLGDDHDLAMLAAWVGEHVGPEPELVDAVEDRRGRLQSEALALGGRLYAEKPSAYIRWIERLWDAGRAGVRAP
ncbi:MAG TPA: CHAD domain-containing protein [Thermoleophilaceae bacterium]|nr:CHAD domain-containing protein [Thermoleophilaceae bacterium]